MIETFDLWMFLAGPGDHPVVDAQPDDNPIAKNAAAQYAGIDE